MQLEKKKTITVSQLVYKLLKKHFIMSNAFFFFHFKKHGLLNNYINVSSYKFIIMHIKRMDTLEEN
jgi:hypothetical protein